MRCCYTFFTILIRHQQSGATTAELLHVLCSPLASQGHSSAVATGESFQQRTDTAMLPFLRGRFQLDEHWFAVAWNAALVLLVILLTMSGCLMPIRVLRYAL